MRSERRIVHSTTLVIPYSIIMNKTLTHLLALMLLLVVWAAPGAGLALAASSDVTAAPMLLAQAATDAPATGTVVVETVEAVAEAAPVLNSGDTAWMLTSTMLVILMTVPGLALFYGGLARAKNMLSVLMQVMVVFALITVLWALYGYSLTFADGGTFYGTFDKLFLKGITPETLSGTIPELVFVAFQSTFAGITCALIVGSMAERLKFAAMLAFAIIWFTLCYIPIAHMVWAPTGLLFKDGALDFAGGTVVHINAGIAGLVGAYVVGKRIGYGREALAPHSLTATMIGASLLWVGWFGFNAGSALTAGPVAALAFINTIVATGAATVAWCFGEALTKGKASMLGAASGAVAGLVAVTPAAGFVGPMGAICLGLIAGLFCLWGVNGLKRLLGADDAFDVFGVHGVGGLVGALLVAVFASPSLGGMQPADYSIGSQFLIQLKGVAITIIWSGLVSLVAYKGIDMVIGLRVTEDEEREGLDIVEHGESAYHA